MSIKKLAKNRRVLFGGPGRIRTYEARRIGGQQIYSFYNFFNALKVYSNSFLIISRPLPLL